MLLATTSLIVYLWRYLQVFHGGITIGSGGLAISSGGIKVLSSKEADILTLYVNSSSYTSNAVSFSGFQVSG
jgi:hypothetical protein